MLLKRRRNILVIASEARALGSRLTIDIIVPGKNPALRWGRRMDTPI